MNGEYLHLTKEEAINESPALNDCTKEIENIKVSELKKISFRI